jgi:HEPN domain-containing protein
MSDPDDFRAWLSKAESDLLCIENNLNDERIPWDTVCFHAQQAAEKLLKSILVAGQRKVFRTHDLLMLLSEWASIDREFEQLRDIRSRFTTRAQCLIRARKKGGMRWQQLGVRARVGIHLGV